MKKSILFLLLTVCVATFSFSSCKKYEENDNFITLIPPTARLDGTWEKTATDNPDTEDWDYTIMFDKDGDCRVEASYSLGGVSFNVDDSGTWAFSDDKEDLIITIDNDTDTWMIEKLTKDELIVKDADGYEWSFNKL